MKIVALAGGVGGAKLADGLAQLIPPDDLTIIVNTGDDFEHLGLSISPDLDTVCYTLAGIANPVTGWGRARETYNLLNALAVLGGETWFRLGDKDLATHLKRTQCLRAGQTLSRVTRDFCRAWDIKHLILPMSDNPVRTVVETVEYGDLAFQDYFVRKKCKPLVKGFRFSGIETALASPGLLDRIENADAVVICPSNPWVSIDPILSVAGIRASAIRKKIVAVSPIIGGKTIKGPAAKMFKELHISPSALAVKEHYEGLIHGFIIDRIDMALSTKMQSSMMKILVTNTYMKSRNDRRLLAENVLNLIHSL
jgi:LPPG:FO 2-phospho-L-lactate transferase